MYGTQPEDSKWSNIFFFLVMLFIAVMCVWSIISSRKWEKKKEAMLYVYNSAQHSTEKPVATKGTDALLMQKMTDGTRSQVLQRKAYVVSYNAYYRIPNWVAWKLTAAHTRGDVRRDEMAFSEDYEADGPRVNTNDYMRSRYDRGHMCPAGDNKWDTEAMEQTFLLTNVCPQHPHLNVEDWNRLEQQTRLWARHYGAVYVVCGPIVNKQNHRTIGRHKVAVPEKFFKVVMRNNGDMAALGFIFANNGTNQPIAQRVVSVDSIEALTGMDFFSALPDEVETRIEASAKKSAWKWDRID